MAESYTFDKQGMRRVVDAVRLTEQNRQLRRGLVDVPTIPNTAGFRIGIIDSSSPTSTVDGSGNVVRWEYTITEARKVKAGYDNSAWAAIPNGLSGTAYHMGEVVNGTDDPPTNPAGLEIQPLATGMPVAFVVVAASVEGESSAVEVVNELWILPAPNGEGGLDEGDMLYWDGLKWVILSAPTSGDHVLMNSGGAPFWQQVQEFECPGDS